MSMIKGLMIKDFQTIKSYKSTIFFMLVIFIGSGFLNDGMSAILPVCMPLCFGMLGISSFSYDNLAKADKFILTFPVDKKDVIKARYMYILLITLFGALFGFALTIVVQSIKIGRLVNLEMIGNTLAIISGALVGVMLLQIFEIPIMYKFGAEKGRIIQMVMIIVLMLSISFITTAFMKIFGVSLDFLIEMLKDYLIAIIGIIVVLLYVFSYKVSCKIYKRKEII